MAKKCKYYINIHYLVNASWESSGNFMFWKSLKFAEYYFHVVIVDVHTSRVACHTCRDLDYCSKQARGTSQHAIIATYHRSVKLEGFYWFGINIFFPVQLDCYGYGSHLVVVPALRVKMTFMRIQNDIHVEMALILTHLSANQISLFSITQHSR